MLSHEFALCKQIPQDILYSKCEKLRAIEISDEFILKNIYLFDKVKLHWEYVGRIEIGLAYHGITIIDNDMGNELKSVLLYNLSDSVEKKQLLEIIEEALLNKYYIVHFGI